jgi:chemotaxis methyl-accepting protein methylase
MVAMESDAKRPEGAAALGVSEAARGAMAPGFLVVGIGASAGSLAALEGLFSAIPSDTEKGMAFVLAQHLAPDHESRLSELVQRYTRMHVFAVEDGMRVEPSRVYVIPPNRNLSLLNGTLALSAPPVSCARQFPIDFFFRSLARECGERAVGVLLSGTGTDGTLGARAIKMGGGLVIAQSAESSAYDGMSRSVIASGTVDYVLPPTEMPARLIAHAAAFASEGRPASSPPSARVKDELERIIGSLRAHTGHDFSQYKQNAIRRRVERRMGLQHIELLSEYCRFLDETPGEATALLRELLIGVTYFFRDPTAFAALEGQLVSRVLASRSSTIRVWVPACATGEEAYSIAILLYEGARRGCELQVFATDVDPKALEVARAGVYPASIARDVGAERLARHFSPLADGRYQVRRAIRDVLFFSEQDVTREPPFSKLDLLSCRNLMIYLNAEMQRRLIPLFHYALNPGGILFLGAAETVGEFVDLFSMTDRQAKLYRRRDGAYGIARLSFGRVFTSAGAGSPARSSFQSRRAGVFVHEGHTGPAPLEPDRELAPGAESPPVAEDARVLALWQEFRERDECAQAAREQMQTANDELQASLEQLQSTNEELQSANEQLETSRSQIQLMNERLSLVNAELQSKVVDLACLNDALNNLLAGAGIGTLFVDRKCCIRRFTSAVTRFIDLEPADIGRPLRLVVANRVEYDRLVADVEAVLGAFASGRIQVVMRAGMRCLLRIRPDITSEGAIEGAAITFSALKLAKDVSATFASSAFVEADFQDMQNGG